MHDSKVEAAMLSRSRDLAACTREFLETISALREQKRTDVETIWNAASHVNIVDHDISAQLYFSTTTGDVWARRSVARHLANIIYEACEDLPQLLGKKFIDACKVAECYTKVESAHRAACKKVSEFAKKNRPLLKKIRHQAGAHKEQDALAFLAAVAEADPDQFVDIAFEFMDLLAELGRMCYVAIEAANVTYRAKGVIL